MTRPARAPAAAAQPLEHGIRKVILRLVKGSEERVAIAAGQVDAVLDPASGKVILLPAAQQALVARKLGLHRLLGLASDWYWEQDREYRFVSHVRTHDGQASFGHGRHGVGPAAHQTHWDADLLGKRLWELPIDNLDAADWQAHRQQLDTRATFRDLELRCRDAAGGRYDLSISGEPIYDEHGEFQGYCGITREISARKQPEARRQVQQQMALASIDALASPLAVLDGDGRLLLLNPAWRTLAGARAWLGADCLLGQDYLEACAQAQAEQHCDGLALDAGIRQLLAGERALFRYTQSSSLQGPAGTEWRGYHFSISAIDGDSDARVLIHIEDISDRLRAESRHALALAVGELLAEPEGEADAAATAASGEPALRAAIRMICAAEGWEAGRYFQFDPAQDALCFAESWGRAEPGIQQFLHRSRALRFKPGAGLSGRVFATGLPLWVIDGRAPTCGLSATALAPETGGEASFVLPVRAAERVLGVLACTARALSPPDDSLLQLANALGRQLGRFLQRQQACNALRRSEQRFRRLTSVSCEWYWETDCELRFTQWVGSSMFDAEFVLGKTLSELPQIELAQAAWAEHETHLEARWSFCDFEFVARHADGALRYYSINGEPVYDESGSYRGYCGTGLDITARKRHEI